MKGHSEPAVSVLAPSEKHRFMASHTVLLHSFISMSHEDYKLFYFLFFLIKTLIPKQAL